MGVRALSVPFVCALEGKATCAKTHVASLHIGGTGPGQDYRPAQEVLCGSWNEWASVLKAV